jgi:hypothetical protein
MRRRGDELDLLHCKEVNEEEGRESRVEEKVDDDASVSPASCR